jgi:hypothetical protein
MLQQMQRQMRGGGGMQEMMKAMMQGQGGDQADMEEMQSESCYPLAECVIFDMLFVSRNDVFHRQRPGRSRRSGRSCRRSWHAGDGRYVQDDGFGRSCKPRSMRYHWGPTTVESMLTLQQYQVYDIQWSPYLITNFVSSIPSSAPRPHSSFQI